MSKIDRNFAALGRRIARLPDTAPPEAPPPLSTLIARVEQAKRVYAVTPALPATR